MKTQLLSLLALIALHAAEGGKKPKRGYILSDHGFNPSATYSDDLNLSQSGWKVSTGDFNLNVDLPSVQHLPQPQIARPVISRPSYPVLSRPISSVGIISNSLDKPVMESQEYIPPQPTGSVVLPQRPIPAIPVNAVAANVPSQTGAVFLGSGSLGVVNLGNGAYALGSGSIGYSGNRSRPRPTQRVPVYPPIPATPDLIPAAVPSPAPAQGPPPFGLVPGDLGFDHPLFNVPKVPQIDQNGYEYLPPNRVGFGQPLPPRPIRTRQQFATPTALQLQSQLQLAPQVPQLPEGYQFEVPLGQHSFNGIPRLV